MLLRIQSFKQAAFWSTGINAFNQVLSLGFSVLMAGFFGAQSGTDVLYYSMGIFTLISQMIQGANLSVLVPETMRRRHQVTERDAMAFINRFLVWIALGVLGLTALLLWKPIPILLRISSFPRETLLENQTLLYWLLASFPLQVLAQILLDILVSYKFLSLPAMLSCVNKVVNLIFVVCFHRRFGITSVAMGMVTGFAFQVLLNSCLLRKVVGTALFSWRTKIGARTWQNIGWVGISRTVSTLASYVPLYLFSGFNAGMLTAMNYARRMSGMPMDLLTTQVSSVTGVKFNEQMAKRQFTEMYASCERILRVLLFVLTPLVVWLALSGYSLVSILFGHGKFQGAAVANTSLLFSLFVLRLPLVTIMLITARLLAANQAIRYGTFWNIFSAALNIGLLFAVVHVCGPVGVPVALFFHMLIYMLCLSISMSLRFEGLNLWAVWRSLFSVAGLCALAGIPAFFLERHASVHLPGWSLFPLVSLVFWCVFSFLVYCFHPDRMALAYWIRLLQTVWRKGWGRLGLIFAGRGSRR
ncbi:MAG: hypothetical protein LBN38_07285 [Verrucomicrobiota bacterium]|jgi:peptidoglycan biosynthesis protein MviN/MurJ (putative lipid II flippase)|nr:hypothetical protein [Verrucomicrobiota bacterium]